MSPALEPSPVWLVHLAPSNLVQAFILRPSVGFAPSSRPQFRRWSHTGPSAFFTVTRHSIPYFRWFCQGGILKKFRGWNQGWHHSWQSAKAPPRLAPGVIKGMGTINMVFWISSKAPSMLMCECSPYKPMSEGYGDSSPRTRLRALRVLASLECSLRFASLIFGASPWLLEGGAGAGRGGGGLGNQRGRG